MRIEYDDELDAWLAIQKHAAAFFGVSVQAFSRWGYLPVKVEGRSKYYDVRAILDDQDEAGADPDSEFGSIADHKLRFEKERADAAELKNRKALGQLIDAGTVIDLLEKLSGEINSIFDTVPNRLKNKYPDLPAAAVRHIESELARARNAVASVRVESSPS